MMADKKEIEDMRRILDIMSTRRSEECSTPRHTEGESLLARYREVQKQGKCPSQSKNFTPTLKNHMIDVCLMELTPSKLTWKRASQLIKVGSFTSKDDLQSTKRKCANALNLHSAATPDLHLIVRGAVVDDSAFSTLASFLNALSPQQRSHLCFGIGIKETVEEPEGSSEVSAIDRSSRSSEVSEGDRSSRKRVREPSPHSLSVSASFSPSLTTQPMSQTGIAVYSYNELMKATDQKSSVMLLGCGGFGKVFLGKLRHTMMAIKFFEVANMELTSALDSLSQEAAILTSYRHPNLVSIFGVCKDPEHPAICYELMDHGSLWECIIGKCKSGVYRGHIEQRIKNLFEASCGLAFLHCAEGGLPVVTHGDIKSTNILLNGHFVAKLGDFGFAQTKPRFEGGKSFWRAGEACGTPGYMAPEVSSGEVSPKVDIYAFGVVILEVYSELAAFDRKRSKDRQTLHEVFDEALDDIKAFSSLVGKKLDESSTRLNCDIPYPELQALAKSCLHYAKYKRASTEQVVQALEELAHSKLVRLHRTVSID